MSSQKMSKGDLTKQRILDVARNLFYKQGYDSTSTAQIAKESNISEAAMYKYFKGKSALLIASVEPTVLFERSKEEYVDLSNKELARLWVNDLLDKVFANRPQFTILFTEAVRHPEISEQYISHVYKHSNGDLEIVKRMDAGLIPKTDLILFQVGMIGSILAMVQHLYIYNEDMCFEKIPPAIHSIILQLVEGELIK